MSEDLVGKSCSFLPDGCLKIRLKNKEQLLLPAERLSGLGYGALGCRKQLYISAMQQLGSNNLPEQLKKLALEFVNKALAKCSELEETLSKQYALERESTAKRHNFNQLIENDIYAEYAELIPGGSRTWGMVYRRYRNEDNTLDMIKAHIWLK